MTTSEKSLPIVKRNLLSSLRRLAASATEQIKWLASMGLIDCADELALELDDYARLAGPLVDQGILTQDQAKAILLVNEQLGRMSGEKNSRLWVFEALKTSPKWERVRKLAAAALILFSEWLE